MDGNVTPRRKMPGLEYWNHLGKCKSLCYGGEAMYHAVFLHPLRYTIQGKDQ